MSDLVCQWVTLAGVVRFVHVTPPFEEVKTLEKPFASTVLDTTPLVQLTP